MGAEGRTRDDGDFFFLDQFFTKFGRRHTRAADIREDVESPFRFKDGQSHIAQAFIDDFAAAVVFLAHGFDVIITFLEGRDAADLGRRIGTHDGVLMELQNRRQAFPRGTDIAQAHTGHGIGLGKAVEDDRPFAHARQFGKGCEFGIAVHEFTIDFIGQDDEVVFFGKFGNGHQFFGRHDRPCRVVGIADDDGLGLGRDDFFQGFDSQFEVVFRIGRHEDRRPAGQFDRRRIGDIGRVGDDDFIARFGNGQKSHGQAFGDADGDQDFVFRVIMDAIVLFKVLANGFTELHHA